MSHLYMTTVTDAIKTSRTARGHKWIDTHVSTWTNGVRIFAHRIINGGDEFQIYLTLNNDRDQKKLIATVYHNPTNNTTTIELASLKVSVPF